MSHIPPLFNRIMDKRFTLILAVVMAFAWLTTVARAITINPTYVNGAGQTWSQTEKDVIQQAINDWQTALPESRTVNVMFDFTNAGTGGYLGMWEGSYSLYAGTDVYPWISGVTHDIHFNADLFSGTTWWDPTPTTSNDLPSNKWDALSVARHEIGHMMGFTDSFYVDNFYTPQEFDKWGIHISGSTFDPGGLNVSMQSTSDLGHVSNSGSTAGDLMVTALGPGVRRGISATDLNMLHLAYNYTIVLPKTPTTYTLTAVAGKTLMHAGDTSSITATITNTGTGNADTLDYTGLRVNSSGGTLGGSGVSGTSGGPLAIAGGNASNSAITFTSANAGSFTITPAATATNHSLGSSATLSSAPPITVTVYSGQGIWNTTGSGAWLDASKWTAAGGVPGKDGALSAADWATFSQYFSSATTVNLNGATPRLAGLDLDAWSNSFTLARGTGSGTLTLQAPSGNVAALTAYHGTNTISAPVVLGGDARIGCDYDATLAFSGGISGNHTLTFWIGTITASNIQVDTLRIGNYASDAATVPEPATFALLGMGFVVLLVYSRRRWKA
jgi:hypothetical protein